MKHGRGQNISQIIVDEFYSNINVVFLKMGVALYLVVLVMSLLLFTQIATERECKEISHSSLIEE